MEPKSLFLSLFLSSIISSSMLGLTSSADSIEQQCSNSFNKVGNCLDYSTGKAATPSQACCTSTKEMRKDEPACMCFFIQQTYKGVPAIKSLGVKVERLLQLPTDCQLTNTSVADCPRLLNLTPGSADYALFTNASSVTTNSSSETASSPKNSSNGSMLKSHFGIISLMVALFLSTFSIRP